MELEVTKEAIQQLFFHPFFYALIGSCFFVFVIYLGDYLLFRKNKTEEQKDWIFRRFWLAGGFIVLTFSWYLLAFKDFSNEFLQWSAFLVMIGFGISSVIFFFQEKFFNKQTTMDKFTNCEKD